MKKKISAILILMTFMMIGHAWAQEEKTEKTDFNKGRLSLYWGWNRAMYSNSDIHFFSPDHDFTLQEVIANDRPTPYSSDIYLNPGLVTIPQTNFRIGYFAWDNWEVSFGVDHMKYVMQQDQMVAIHGWIVEPGTEFTGVYKGEEIMLTEEFLTFEHTDGLNYVNFEMNRYHRLVSLRQHGSFDMDVSILGGGGLGILLPKSNVQMFGKNRYDDFNVAGYGFSLKGGLNLTFYRFFFLQTEMKGGFITMNDIITSTNNDYRAAQNFYFLQWNFVFGGYIPLIKNNKKD